jgi:hypothetical protein
VQHVVAAATILNARSANRKYPETDFEEVNGDLREADFGLRVCRRA